MASSIQRINLGTIKKLAEGSSDISELRDPELKGFGVHGVRSGKIVISDAREDLLDIGMRLLAQ